jgi:Domain of unknown function (DUF4258)
LLIRLSKHAQEKLTVRQLDIRMIEEVLENPGHRFYDTLAGSEVAAKVVKMKEEVLTLAVVYAIREDAHYVITVYPSKGFKAEADRKVKFGRWVLIPDEP